MAERGWNGTKLAQRARVSNMTITRFLSGEAQSNKTADRIARALGHTTRRYLIGVTSAGDSLDQLQSETTNRAGKADAA